MTYEEAIAYLTPHPNNRATILLQADKVREALRVITEYKWMYDQLNK